jgi:hemin uptake protein HemP
MNNAFNIKFANVGTDNVPQPHPKGTNKARKTTSVELFGGSKELVIEHAGERYVLRHTNLGKLILTK